jgi:hypothetical protein
VSGIITERGICAASEEGILSLFPEYNTWIWSSINFY